MKDLQFIVLSDTLDIVSQKELEGRSQRTIEVKSTGNLNYTKKVVINSFSVTDFTLIDKETLHVRLPSQLLAVDVDEMDIRIFSSRQTKQGSAFMEFDLTNRFTSVEGSQKLAQQVVKTLITTVRTNRFNESEGGSLTKVLGGTLSPTETSRVAAAVSRAVSDTKSFYVEAQSNTRLPLNERLLNLTLSSVEFDSTALEVKAVIRMTTFSGTTELLPIVL